MSDFNHSLYTDFPQYADRIRQLKQEDATFASLASEYHKLDHSVRGLESRNIPTSDQNFEQMKLRRVQLKDQILRMLK